MLTLNQTCKHDTVCAKGSIKRQGLVLKKKYIFKIRFWGVAERSQYLALC